MVKHKDLTGKRFGRLLVVDEAPPRWYGGKRAIYWNCICDCGEKREVHASSLVAGTSTSCGCSIRGEYDTYIGKTFGELTVIGYEKHQAHQRNTLLVLQCSCGEITKKTLSKLLHSSTKCCPACSRKIKRKPKRFKHKDMSGEVVKDWVIINEAGFGKYAYIWNAKCCMCGYHTVISSTQIATGSAPECMFCKTLMTMQKLRDICSTTQSSLKSFMPFERMNGDAQVIFECQEHGEWRAKLKNFLYSDAKCPYCSGKDFLRKNTKYLYVMLVDGIYSFCGFGVTSDIPSRMGNHRKSIKDSGCFIEFGLVFEFNSYEECLSAETKISNTFPSKKVDVQSFITENTHKINFNSIVDFVKLIGGVYKCEIKGTESVKEG